MLYTLHIMVTYKVQSIPLRLETAIAVASLSTALCGKFGGIYSGPTRSESVLLLRKGTSFLCYYKYSIVYNRLEHRAGVKNSFVESGIHD